MVLVNSVNNLQSPDGTTNTTAIGCGCGKYASNRRAVPATGNRDGAGGGGGGGQSKNAFWPPLLTCTKRVYCRVWVTTMHHQRHSLRPLGLRTQNGHVYVLQSRIERHSRTVILCPQNSENIHQINNERKPTRARKTQVF